MWCVQECLDLFVVPGLDKIFLNLFNRSDQRRVQVDRPSSTVLTKDREHGSHIVVVHELHRLNRTVPAESVDGRRYSTPSILRVSL